MDCSCYWVEAIPNVWRILKYPAWPYIWRLCMLVVLTVRLLCSMCSMKDFFGAVGRQQFPRVGHCEYKVGERLRGGFGAYGFGLRGAGPKR